MPRVCRVARAIAGNEFDGAGASEPIAVAVVRFSAAGNKAAIRQPAMSHAETNRFGQGTSREDQTRVGAAVPAAMVQSMVRPGIPEPAVKERTAGQSISSLGRPMIRTIWRKARFLS